MSCDGHLEPPARRGLCIVRCSRWGLEGESEMPVSPSSVSSAPFATRSPARRRVRPGRNAGEHANQPPLRAAVAFAFRAEISKGERYLPIPHTRRFVRSPSASPPRVSSRPGTCLQQFGRTSLTCHAAGLFTLRWVWPRTRVKRAVRWRHRRSLRRRRHPPARSHRARAYHHDRHE